MFKKILVANRGEIALRILRAARELGIETVAVYSEADRDSLHVRFADEAVCIGPPPSSASYLHIPRIISAAEITAADAIHPGYGFLSENAHFAEVVESCHIRFIGPTAEQIRRMGDKAAARKAMVAAGVPVTPGSQGTLESADEVRTKMGQAAVTGAKSIGYESCGTIEFLLATDRRFYFMEMNTRIQVEHPVTEEVTGYDLIKAQIAVAAGVELPWKQEDVRLRGHALECRVNAEKPDHNFQPSPGKVSYVHAPAGPGVRVDSHLSSGSTVPTHYDSMVAKIITWGRDRMESIVRMRRALEETVIEGIDTTIPLHLRILEDPAFLNGDIHTGYLDEFLSLEHVSK